MKMPLFLKWVGHVLTGVWRDMSGDSKAGCVIFWGVISVADILVLLFCFDRWTRESGYGWVQGAYNWGMLLFWLTGLPFLLILAYYFVMAVWSLFSSARDSYKAFKRDNL